MPGWRTIVVTVVLVGLVVWSSSEARGHASASVLLAALAVVGLAYWARGTDRR